jgi:hypothetical protein
LRHLLRQARKDPQKTAGLIVTATLSIGALILWLGYLRSPAASQPQVISLKKPTAPTTRPALSSMADDATIIQANALAVEKRRLALRELAEARALSRPRPQTHDRTALFETAFRRALADPQVPLQKPPHPPTTRPMPTTSPTTQPSAITISQ